MPSRKLFTKSTFVAKGIPEEFDYDEYLAETYRRLDACGKRDAAKLQWAKAVKKNPDLATELPEGADKRTSPKARWYRLHCVPDEILERVRAEGSQAACETDSGERVEAVETPAVEAASGESLFLDPVCKIVHAEETVDETVQSAVESQEGKKPKVRDEERYGNEENPVDSTLEPPKEVRSLTLAELVTACTWAFDNVHYVKSGRVKIRHAPVSPSGCWSLVEWLRVDNKGFFSFFFDKLKAWEKEQEAKREKAEKSLRDEDTELFDVFDELGATG